MPARHRASEITVLELNDALDSFSNRYLRGAIALTSDTESREVLDISLEYTAYMLRLLVECAAHDRPLSVNISCAKEIYTWRVDFGNSLPARAQVYRIQAAASKAGFSYREEGAVLILGMKTKRRQVLSVYAASRTDAEQALAYAFLY